MKSNLSKALAGVFLVGLVFALISLTWDSTGEADLQRVVAALRSYSAQSGLSAESGAVSVTFSELVGKGYLQADEVGAFRGSEVTLYPLMVDAPSDAAVLSIRLPDGHTLVLLNDGSVRHR